jgi:hypothetical protein
MWTDIKDLALHHGFGGPILLALIGIAVLFAVGLLVGGLGRLFGRR